MTNLFNDPAVAQDPDTRLHAAYVEECIQRPPVRSCRIENVGDENEVKDARRCASQYATRDIARTLRAAVAAGIGNAEWISLLEKARRSLKGK